MINIRPVSDLRNKYPEIEEIVLKEGGTVYLTKNGYGSMVIMDLEKYSKLKEESKKERTLEEKVRNINIRKTLDVSEKGLDDLNAKYLMNEEVLPKARKIMIDDE